MEKLYNLKDKLCEELEEYARKQEMGAGDLEVIHKLTDTIKNIDKICILEDSKKYSEDGNQGRGSYDRDSSYANRGQHYVRGHYSREGGNYGGNGGGRVDYSSRRGGYRSGYSREDGRSEMMEHLEMAMDSATDQDRETIKRFMRQLENA